MTDTKDTIPAPAPLHTDACPHSDCTGECCEPCANMPKELLAGTAPERVSVVAAADAMGEARADGVAQGRRELIRDLRAQCGPSLSSTVLEWLRHEAGK